MALNASIFGNMLNAPKSPEEYLAERQNLQASKLANALNQQKADEYTKGIARQGELLNLLAGGADSGALRQAGFLGEAADWDKNAAIVAKDKAAAAKDTNDANLKTWQAYRDQSSMIRSPQEAAAWITRGYNDPVIGPFLQRFGSLEEGVSRIPTDPAGFEQWRMGVGSNVDKMAEHAMKQQEFGLKQDQFGETVRDNKARIAATIRGQDKADARARDFNAVQVEANNIKRSEKQDVANMTKNSQIASFDTMLGTLDRLIKHPGLSRSVGMVGAFPTMPGSESANFQAELDTFQSQAFIPMVAQLKGMGALSDAEGKKLTAAVGALNPKMGEQAFRDSVARITADMEAARARVSGQPRAPKPAMSPQDQQAADWANANPNDPRAAKIKQRLGM